MLIVGGGISGLSAARALSRKGIEDFILLDMDEQPGGNSRWGSNEHGAFPLGAHYLPLPNSHDAELIQFLQEEGIVVLWDKSALDEEVAASWAGLSAAACDADS